MKVVKRSIGVVIIFIILSLGLHFATVGTGRYPEGIRLLKCMLLVGATFGTGAAIIGIGLLLRWLFE